MDFQVLEAQGDGGEAEKAALAHQFKRPQQGRGGGGARVKGIAFIDALACR